MMRILLLIACYLDVLSLYAVAGDAHIIVVQAEYPDLSQNDYQLDELYDPFDVLLIENSVCDLKESPLLDFRMSEREAIKGLIKNSRTHKSYIHIFKNESGKKIIQATKQSLPDPQFSAPYFRRNIEIYSSLLGDYYLKYSSGNIENKIKILNKQLALDLDAYIRNCQTKIKLNISGLKNPKKQYSLDLLGLDYFIQKVN